MQKYHVLKDHFDRLINGGYPPNSGLDPIRSTYERMFNMPINLQEIYKSNMSINTNPINSIITLVSPESEERDIPTGVICYYDNKIGYVNNITDSDIFNGKVYDGYLRWVFDSMYDIVSYDFLKRGEKATIENPCMTLLHAIPFFYTFHHIRECVPDLFAEDNFAYLLELYYMDKEYIPKVLESVYSNKYTTDPETIYSIMTCKHTINIL